MAPERNESGSEDSSQTSASLSAESETGADGVPSSQLAGNPLLAAAKQPPPTTATPALPLAEEPPSTASPVAGEGGSRSKSFASRARKTFGHSFIGDAQSQQTQAVTNALARGRASRSTIQRELWGETEEDGDAGESP